MVTIPFAVLATLAFVVGAVMGSFGNVLIFRLPAGQSVLGRSACRGCVRMLSFLEMIPIVSFIVLRGRCRGCGQRFSLQYPIVELLSGVGAVAAVWFYPAALLESILLFLQLWLLLIIAITDARTGHIPDLLNLPLIAIGVLLVILHWPAVALLSAFILTLFFGAQWMLSSGRWVGSGDVLLALGIGLFLPRASLAIVCLLVAYICGAIVGGVLLLLGEKSLKSSLPFGPFLVLGAYAAFFYGNQIISFLLPWA